MWMADLRAVTFSGLAVLRPMRPDALRSAVASVAAERPPSPAVDLDVAWTRYEAERARHRWTDHGEQMLVDFLAKAGLAADASEFALAVADRFGESLEWHADAIPTLDYLRESGYRTVLLLDFPLVLPPAWRERSAQWFDQTVASIELLRRTPDSAPFQEALRRLRSGPGKVLHVGEGVVEDMYAARAVQLRTALLERFGRSPQDAEAGDWLRRVHGVEPSSVIPDLKLRTLEDLPRALDSFA